MKHYLLAVSFCFVLGGFAQETQEIDPSLMVSEELGAKAVDYMANDPEEYQYLVFELDNAYFIKSYESLTNNQKAQLRTLDGVLSTDGKPFDPIVLQNGEFNFHNYNFERSETQTIGYDLGNGQVLVFYSLEKLRIIFDQK